MTLRTYTAPHAVFTGGKMYKPGQPFTTSEPKGDRWEAITKAEKVAAEASDRTQREDPPIDESLGLHALKAIAVERGVNPRGLSAKALVDAIKAADEPAL